MDVILTFELNLLQDLSQQSIITLSWILVLAEKLTAVILEEIHIVLLRHIDIPLVLQGPLSLGLQVLDVELQ